MFFICISLGGPKKDALINNAIEWFYTLLILCLFHDKFK